MRVGKYPFVDWNENESCVYTNQLRLLSQGRHKKKKEITQALILLKTSLTAICFAQLFFECAELNQSYQPYHPPRGKLEVFKMWVISLAVNSSYISSNPYIINCSSCIWYSMCSWDVRITVDNVPGWLNRFTSNTRCIGQDLYHLLIFSLVLTTFNSWRYCGGPLHLWISGKWVYSSCYSLRWLLISTQNESTLILISYWPKL